MKGEKKRKKIKCAYAQQFEELDWTKTSKSFQIVPTLFVFGQNMFPITVRRLSTFCRNFHLHPRPGPLQILKPCKKSTVRSESNPKVFPLYEFPLA